MQKRSANAMMSDILMAQQRHAKIRNVVQVRCIQINTHFPLANMHPYQYPAHEWLEEHHLGIKELCYISDEVVERLIAGEDFSKMVFWAPFETIGWDDAKRSTLAIPEQNWFFQDPNLAMLFKLTFA